MPPIGLLIGGVNLRNLKRSQSHKVKEGVEAVTLNYGTFIQTIIDFTIIAFSIFMVIRLINKLHNLTKKKEEEVQAAPLAAPEPTKEEILLTEIRDLLKSKN
jgi:large conductance mechanosensitive channel